MFASDARLKTVENSQLLKNIMVDIERAIENEKFEISLYQFEDFLQWTPLGEAVTKVLRDKGFTVEIDEFTYMTSISWK